MSCIQRLLMCLVVSLTVSTNYAAEPESQPTRQGNVYGINLGWIPGWSTVSTARLCGLSHHLVGDWGYIRHGIMNYDDVEQVKLSMALMRANHLISISGGIYPYSQFLEEGRAFPKLDADGTMRTAARAKAREFKLLYDAKIPFYVVEVMNEINNPDVWPADKYAQWLYDIAVELKKAYPGLKVCSAGMAGSGKGYYDKILTCKPELKEVVDFWGLHPYGANNPPEYGPDGTSLRCYEETIADLEKHGVDPIRLMCTETGYELEIGDTGKNNKYPPIREDNRAEYMARAFRDYYVPEPRIEAVAPFQLWDMPWHNWNGWDFMYHDGRPRPIFESIAAMPKSGGKDWLETGDGAIRGRVTWADSGIGVPRVIVYTEPGLYGAMTDDNGRYEITGLPMGQYDVQAFASGWTDARTSKVNVKKNKPGAYDAKMKRVTLAGGSFGLHPTDPTQPDGWDQLAASGQIGNGQLETIELASGKQRVLRVDLAEGQAYGLSQYGAYNSAYPNEVYVAEVNYRCEDVDVKAKGGPWVSLAISNGRGELLAEAKAYPAKVIADGKWHRVTAALHAPADGSRVRIDFGADNATGRFWFQTPFVGEADFPLPGDAAYRTTGYVPPLYELNKGFFGQAVVDIAKRNPKLKTATITGQVLDFRGRPTPLATIATDEPVFTTVCDNNGQFKLTVPADQEFRVRAFAAGAEPVMSDPIRVKIGKTLALDLQTAAPPVPDALVNGNFDDFFPPEGGVPAGWTSFGTTSGAGPHPNIFVDTEPYASNGLYYAGSGSNVKNGGAYQTLVAKPGTKYRATTVVQTRTVGDSQKPMDNNCLIGIDPTGGRDPESADIVWSDAKQSEYKWVTISTEATAQTERITIFIRHEMRRANIWNLTLFDEVTLEEMD